MIPQDVEKTQTAYASMQLKPYTPVCLTLYLSNTCNLSCGYCYSRTENPNDQHLTIDEIIIGARLVAQNCSEQGKLFTVVFHGGGEPTLDFALMKRALLEINKIAKQYHVEVSSYLATNGVMSPAKAEWVAENFNLVGLSCDGPRDIQELQRPLRIDRNGLNSSSFFVEQTARIFRKAGRDFDVRVTITPSSVDRQPEIADYICDTLCPREIHVEPVYMWGRGTHADFFTVDMAEHFVSGFFEAQEVAAKRGISWTTSCMRIDEIHGPYCHIFRDVLNIIPGGWITACFKISQVTSPGEQYLIIGKVDRHLGKVVLNEIKIASLREKYSHHSHPLVQCEQCFNHYHCVVMCPDYCVLHPDERNDQLFTHNLFRCNVASLLAMRLIGEKAVHREHI